MSDYTSRSSPDAPASALESRLAAVERAVTDGETHLDDLADAAELVARVDELESAVTTLDDRLAEVEAATRALRGYVGGVRAVNESVERRADAALAAVESVEEALRDDPSGEAFERAAAAATDVREQTDPAVDASRPADDAPQGETLAARLRDS